MDGGEEDGAACDADHEPPALLKLPRQAMTYAARDSTLSPDGEEREW